MVSSQGNAEPIPADQLAVNLIGSHLQLVVLSACETGKRDAQNLWSGVVSALTEAEVPAVVAMQFSIWDKAAITFAHDFYQIIAAGLPLDYAVSEARRAIFNLCNPLKDHNDRSKYWRDWGVPVLYLQTVGDFSLPSIIEPNERDAVQLYYKGLNAYYQRKYEVALEYLNQATQFNPELSDAWELIIHILQMKAMYDIYQRRYPAARKKLIKANEAARNVDPLDARVMVLRGMVNKTLAQVHRGEGDHGNANKYWSKAEQFFKQALNFDIKDESAYLGLGNVVHERGDIKRAIHNYSKAIELNPKYTSAFHDQALAYEQLMKIDTDQADVWCLCALNAWQNTYKYAENDPGYSQKYIQNVILPRIEKMTELNVSMDNGNR